MVRPKPVIPLAAIGLTPILPLTRVVPVVEIPDFARITKLTALPRFMDAAVFP